MSTALFFAVLAVVLVAWFALLCWFTPGARQKVSETFWAPLDRPSIDYRPKLLEARRERGAA